MDDTKKMLRAIINGQSALKEEILAEVKKVRTDISEHKQETKSGFEKVNKRVDSLGSSLAYLEDDAPTRKEHDGLEKRVDKLEHKTASV